MPGLRNLTGDSLERCCLSCLSLSYLLHAPSCTSIPQKARELVRAFSLHSTTSHARFLPADVRHAFAYPVLSLLLLLSALESGRPSLLNMFLFSFGTIRAFSVYAVQGISMTTAEANRRYESSLRVRCRIFSIQHANEQTDDAWILTIPSYFGFEGIKPLTVYFCYRKGNPNSWSWR